MNPTIVKFEGVLLVSIQSFMDDRAAVQLAEDLAESVVRHASSGVIIDISTVDVLDTFLGRTIGSMAATCRLLGAETVVVGMRPEVAMTLVELGMDLPGVATALTVEHGIGWLRRRLLAKAR